MKKYYKPLDYVALAMVRARQGRAEAAVQALFSAATHPAAIETLALIERSQKHALKMQASAKKVGAGKRLKAEEEGFDEVDVNLEADAVTAEDDGGDVDLNIDVDTDDDDDLVPEEVDSKARAAFAKLLKGMKQ